MKITTDAGYVYPKDKIDKLISVCNSWLETYGFTTRVSEEIEYWAYNEKKNLIFLEINEMPAQTEEWEVFIYRDCKCPIKCDSFYSSFLHELGHAQTWTKFSYEELHRGYGMNSFDYFMLPKEKVATDWAINFMRTNPLALANLIGATGPLIEELRAYN